jgi:hypothetical protein
VFLQRDKTVFDIKSIPLAVRWSSRELINLGICRINWTAVCASHQIRAGACRLGSVHGAEGE